MSPSRNIAKLLCFLFSIGFHNGMAQNEGSIWYLGSDQGLDFSQTPPSPIPTGGFSTTIRSEEGFATLTENGKVIFHSDGSFVGYPDGQAVENGYYLFGTRERQVIIKKPGSTSQYYIFYVASLSWDKRKDLMYCVVDVQVNGIIKVLEKNIVLYEGLHGYFTISAGCAGKNFWLVSEADRNITEGTDKIFSFKIDSVGISDRIVSAPLPMTKSGAYRFSPDGTKLFFHFSASATEGTALADFDRTTGIVSNVNVIGPCCGFGEFSSNGKMLYTNYSTEDEMNIIQYDLSQVPIISKTITTIPFHGKRLQIARDGKIYIVLIDTANLCTLGVINNPNLTGASADFQMSSPFWPYPDFIVVLPEFSTNTFYESPFSADAGEDKEVCLGDKISIGGTNASNQRYQWFPDQYLANPQAGQTDFVFNESISTTQELQYILKGLGDECVKADTMTILVHPRPMPSISGSYSVCPGVSSVLYSTDYDSNYSYDWSVEGGTIVSSNIKDSIHVDWGISNPEAKVHLSVNNEFDCISDPVTFPVRINIKLETQTPEGLLHVCDNLVVNNNYQINNTNGSIYTWGIIGGEINQGQGSNKLIVNWLPSDIHQLWVSERSTTMDTVCFGSSDTLNIKVYVDSMRVFLDVVSVHSEDDSKSTVMGRSINLPLNFSFPVTVLRGTESESSWNAMEEFDITENLQFRFEDNDLFTDNLVYEYKLSTINGCQLEVSSNVHNTMRLEVEASEEEGKIILKWNPYVGWPENVLRYEIWRKIDAEKVFSFIGSTDQQTISLHDADKGFKHSFMVKAISNLDTVYSWSNTVLTTFKHQLVIPNIFTPNGDRLNETFFLRHIELYPQNELTIYNRYGEKIFNSIGYDNSWNGESLTNGIYYYNLRVYNTEQPLVYKGWVQIMR